MIPDAQAIKLMVGLNARIVVGLIDAAERADTPAQRSERLALARDAVLEFKTDIAKWFASQPTTPQPNQAVIPHDGC